MSSVFCNIRKRSFSIFKFQTACKIVLMLCIRFEDFCLAKIFWTFWRQLSEFGAERHFSQCADPFQYLAPIPPGFLKAQWCTFDLPGISTPSRSVSIYDAHKTEYSHDPLEAALFFWRFMSCTSLSSCDLEEKAIGLKLHAWRPT